MIRIIVETRDGFPDGTAGPAEYTTFDAEAPALEAYLEATGEYRARRVIGAEVLAAEAGGE